MELELDALHDLASETDEMRDLTQKIHKEVQRTPPKTSMVVRKVLTPLGISTLTPRIKIAQGTLCRPM
jgi:hypothetical protein